MVGCGRSPHTICRLVKILRTGRVISNSVVRSYTECVVVLFDISSLLLSFANFFNRHDSEDLPVPELVGRFYRIHRNLVKVKNCRRTTRKGNIFESNEIGTLLESSPTHFDIREYD